MVRDDTSLRIGQAAALLGVSVDTIRRWDDQGTIRVDRTGGGQRRIPAAEIRRLSAARREAPHGPRIVASSARNQMAGVVTEIVTGPASAVVEIQAGPFRLVSLMTSESVAALGLEVGTQVVASVKATNVVVGLPG